jgi:SPP1 family predicted phage head-tail adaptor
MPVRAGTLDRRIVILEKVAVQNDDGEEIAYWFRLATVWASVQQQSGREFFAAQQTLEDRRILFRIRWRPDVTVLNRIEYRGELFDIQEARELGRREGLDLYAKPAPAGQQ